MFIFFPAFAKTACSFFVGLNGIVIKNSSKNMSSFKFKRWNFLYINGPDKPVYFRRVESVQKIQNESESRNLDNKSEIFNSKFSKYLLFTTNSSDSSAYVDSAVKSHLAYRQNGSWPCTLFSHCVFIDTERSTDGEQFYRGVFCCCTSQDHMLQVDSDIQDFVKKETNFIALKFQGTGNENVFDLIQPGNTAGTGSNADTDNIKVQLIDRAAVKCLQESDSVTSPIFCKPEISPVFHSFKEAEEVLKQLSDVPEVKELLDISGKYATVLTDKLSCDQSCVHPFVVVEGMDATGKTTLTEILEKKMGAARYFTPPPKITHLRAFFDKYPEIVRRAYYSMGNYIVAGDIIKECQTRPVIMDRFWHSTAAYGIANETSSGDLPESNHPVYTWPSDLLKPTIVLFLTVSEDVRKQRLSGRGIQATFEERSLDNDQLFRQRLCDAYRRMSNPSCKEINADGTVEEVQSQALELLKSFNVDLGSSELMDIDSEFKTCDFDMTVWYRPATGILYEHEEDSETETTPDTTESSSEQNTTLN